MKVDTRLALKAIAHLAAEHAAIQHSYNAGYVTCLYYFEFALPIEHELDILYRALGY